jgi:hypothetical protein
VKIWIVGLVYEWLDWTSGFLVGGVTVSGWLIGEKRVLNAQRSTLRLHCWGRDRKVVPYGIGVKG